MKHSQLTYISFGKLISSSLHHNELWIISYPDGGFVSIHADERTMRLRHQEGGTFEYNERFAFAPSKAREKPLIEKGMPGRVPKYNPVANARIAAKRDFRLNY